MSKSRSAIRRVQSYEWTAIRMMVVMSFVVNVVIEVLPISFWVSTSVWLMTEG
jgi:hypothetical protein